METSRLIAVEVPHKRYVIRLRTGPRIGTVFSTRHGWHYQFDGSWKEGPGCRGPREAMSAMETVAEQNRILPADPSNETALRRATG